MSSPADVLSYVPHALGFTPVESLVVMTLAGKRLGATLRVDLPMSGPGTFDGDVVFAEAVLSFLRGDDAADGVLLAVYTHEEQERSAPPPREGLVRALRDVFGAAGLPVRSGWLVSGATWRDLFCSDEHCCPWPGHPLDTVLDSYLNAEMIFGGSSFDASAAAAVLRSAPEVGRLGPSPQRDAWEIEEAQAHFAAACSGHWDEDAQFRATSVFWDAVLERQDAVEAADEPGRVPRARAGSSPAGRSSARLDVHSIGFLLASLESKSVRDFLLVSACLGSVAALDGIRAESIVRSDSRMTGTPHRDGAVDPAGYVLPLLPDGVADAVSRETARAQAASRAQTPRAGNEGVVVPAAHRLFTEVLAGLHCGPVDWVRVDRMTELLVGLVSVAGPSGEARAAALTMLGWFEYARGRGSRAAVYFDAAEEALPGYRLARLLDELLSRGGLPEWARRRSTAWRPTTAASPSTAA